MKFYSQISMIFAISAILALCPISGVVLSAHAQVQGVRITSIRGYDLGDIGGSSAGTQQLDLAQNICEYEDSDSDGVPETLTLEDFTDSFVGMEISSNHHSTIRFYKVTFVVKSGGVSGRTIRSKKVLPIDTIEVDPDSTATVTAFFLKAKDGVKVLPTSKGDQALSSGFRTVTVRLHGSDSTGRRFKLRGRSTFSLADFNRCE